MAQVNNRDVIKRIEKDAFTSPGFEQVPTQLSNQIVPTLNCNPERVVNIVKSSQGVATGTVTVYTSPGDKEFYLTQLSAEFIKDVACDLATGRISILGTIMGASVDLISFPVITLTAQDSRGDVFFNPPIKIDKDSAIQMTGNYAAGVMSRTITIKGYTVEPQ